MEIYSKEVHSEEISAVGLTIKIITSINTNRTYSVLFKAYDNQHIKVWETELMGANSNAVEFKTLQEAIATARSIFQKEIKRK